MNKDNNNNKVGFFQEEVNVNSVTRLAFFILICQAVFLSSYMIIVDKPVVDAVMVFTTITAVATTLKLVQKGQENKLTKDN